MGIYSFTLECHPQTLPFQYQETAPPPNRFPIPFHPPNKNPGAPQPIKTQERQWIGQWFQTTGRLTKRLAQSI